MSIRPPNVDNKNASLLYILPILHPESVSGCCRRPFGVFRPLPEQRVMPFMQGSCRTPATRCVRYYKLADWNGMRTFYPSYPWRPDCFSTDNPSIYAAAVAVVVLQGMELFNPSTVMPIGGKSRPWFYTPCKVAVLSKREACQIWAEALVTKHPKVKALKSK